MPVLDERMVAVWVDVKAVKIPIPGDGKVISVDFGGEYRWGTMANGGHKKQVHRDIERIVAFIS